MVDSERGDTDGSRLRRHFPPRAADIRTGYTLLFDYLLAQAVEAQR
jgi:hypothetical protein